MGRFITQGRAPIAYMPRPAGQHGTYDRSGNWCPQLVHLGVTEGGTPGLFTGGTLAWPISMDLYHALRTDYVGLQQYAAARGFTLVD